MSGNPYESTSHVGRSEPVKSPPIFRFLVELAVVICIIGLILALLLPATRNARTPALRVQCANHVKQIALALHSYEAEYGSLPPAYTVDSEGRPLHSWRTLILPYLEEQTLYDSIDLSKPWNDPVNLKASKTELSVFRCPTSTASSNSTNYLVVNDSGGCFYKSNARKLADIRDGSPNTLMVLEVPDEFAVPWMAPRDADAQMVMDFDEETSFAHRDVTTIAFGDATVQFLSADVSVEERRAMISMAADD